METEGDSLGGLWNAGSFCALAIILSACAAFDPQDPVAAQDTTRPEPVFVRLPLHPGWHEGRRVFYVTTDASDQDVARKEGANYAPRLANAIPDLPQTPGQRSVVERIYVVTNYKQDNVLPSVPVPVGPDSTDKAYSPLWLMNQVTWHSASTATTLRSEADILDAEDRGEVTIVRTPVVVNCPVIFSDKGGALPGAKRIGRFQ